MLCDQKIKRCRFIVWYQVWKPIIRLYILPPGHLTCSFVCHFHGEHTVLQPSWRIELIVHIAISVLPGTHFHLSQVKHLRVKCLAQNTTSWQCPQIERGETWYFSENPAPSGIRNRTAGSDIGRAPRSNHCAMSLSTKSIFRAMWQKIWLGTFIYFIPTFIQEHLNCAS